MEPRGRIVYPMLSRSLGLDAPPLEDAAQGRRCEPAGGVAMRRLACWVAAALWVAGCGKPQPVSPERAGGGTSDDVSQSMDRFTMEGFAPDGTRRWDLEGTGASIEGEMVSVRNPEGKGYDKARTAHLDARMAHINQTNRRIRLEHQVNIHTSDGVWFQTPMMYWLPDQDQFTTELPVRIETDHMLIRGRGAKGKTQLKVAAVMKDIEVILNPTEEHPVGVDHHVKITCDGPLSFDYDHNIATFERNVHVTDPQGEMFSSKLVAYMDPVTRTIAYAEATGDVKILQGGHTAAGGRAVYEPAKGKLTLLDSPSMMLSLEEGKTGGVPVLSLAGPSESDR